VACRRLVHARCVPNDISKRPTHGSCARGSQGTTCCRGHGVLLCRFSVLDVGDRYHDGVCYIIDVAQAVPTSHRDARDLLAADCDAVTQFFQDRGCGVLPYATLASMIIEGNGAAVGSADGACTHACAHVVAIPVNVVNTLRAPERRACGGGLHGSCWVCRMTHPYPVVGPVVSYSARRHWRRCCVAHGHALAPSCRWAGGQLG
jgi:hypothetical protein